MNAVKRFQLQKLSAPCSKRQSRQKKLVHAHALKRFSSYLLFMRSDHARFFSLLFWMFKHLHRARYCRRDLLNWIGLGIAAEALKSHPAKAVEPPAPIVGSCVECIGWGVPQFVKKNSVAKFKNLLKCSGDECLKSISFQGSQWWPERLHA